MTESNISTSQASTMLHLQYKLNSIVDANWIEKKFPYLRAAFMEAAEALEHFGWKWWKKQECDIAQVKLELSDILHFYLSDLLISSNGNIEESTKLLISECNCTLDNVTIDEININFSELDTRALFELIAAFSALRRRSFPLFNEILERIEMDWQELYQSYTSKNILNIFRQDNGYKAGTYCKTWDDKEDNLHLAELAATLDERHPNYADELYNLLREKYLASTKQP